MENKERIVVEFRGSVSFDSPIEAGDWGIHIPVLEESLEEIITSELSSHSPMCEVTVKSLKGFPILKIED